jgi:glucose-1-phosphate adenylyltransferase
MPGAVVKEGACVVRALVADGIEIGAGAVVGNADSEEITLVAQNV